MLIGAHVGVQLLKWIRTDRMKIIKANIILIYEVRNFHIFSGWLWFWSPKFWKNMHQSMGKTYKLFNFYRFYNFANKFLFGFFVLCFLKYFYFLALGSNMLSGCCSKFCFSWNTYKFKIFNWHHNNNYSFKLCDELW